MKKLFKCLIGGVIILGLTGCKGEINSSNLQTIGEYEYASTLECEAFDKGIKYFNYSGDDSKGWMVTEDNDIYIIDTYQKYSKTDSNCKKLNEKFDDNIIHIRKKEIGNYYYNYYYNSNYQTINVNLNNEKIEYSAPAIKHELTTLKILLKNNYYRSYIDSFGFLRIFKDNNVYNAEVEYVKFTKITGEQNGKLVDIFLIPNEIYNKEVDVDFNVEDYLTHVTTKNGYGDIISEYKVDDYITIPVTNTFEFQFKMFNGKTYEYNLVVDGINKMYVFDEKPTENEYSVPLNKLNEELVFSVPNDEEIIDMLFWNSDNEKMYILTNKNYYRYMLDNGEECTIYSDVECKYAWKKDEELSKIRNDILYRDASLMILKNGKLYYPSYDGV